MSRWLRPDGRALGCQLLPHRGALRPGQLTGQLWQLLRSGFSSPGATGRTGGAPSHRASGMPVRAAILLWCVCSLGLQMAAAWFALLALKTTGMPLQRLHYGAAALATLLLGWYWGLRTLVDWKRRRTPPAADSDRQPGEGGGATQRETGHAPAKDKT